LINELGQQNWQVPNCVTKTFFPKRQRYCVGIFVINEGNNIRQQLKRIRPFTDRFDILIADGGSTDGSLDDDLLIGTRVRALLVKTGPGGLGAKMRIAIAYSLQEGYEGIICIDGNNKDDPDAIPRFSEALSAGFDHVQGSRFIAGGRGINTPISRLLGIKLVHAPLISLVAGFRYTDTTNGFRAYSRRFLVDPRVAPLRSIFSAYELHYYLAIRASRLGFNVTEIPVTRVYPDQGPTPTKISPLKGNIIVLKTLMQACLGRFNPPASQDRGAD
jgi:dolichol-phosphate mannosyltransferase